MEPIRLDFTYTAEDFTEAVRAVQKHGLKRSVGGFRFDRITIGWIVFIGLAVVLFTLLSRQSPTPPPPFPQRQESLFRTILLPLLPWLGVFLVIWFFVFRLLRGAGK